MGGHSSTSASTGGNTPTFEARSFKLGFDDHRTLTVPCLREVMEVYDVKSGGPKPKLVKAVDDYIDEHNLMSCVAESKYRMRRVSEANQSVLASKVNKKRPLRSFITRGKRSRSTK